MNAAGKVAKAELRSDAASRLASVAPGCTVAAPFTDS